MTFDEAVKHMVAGGFARRKSMEEGRVCYLDRTRGKYNIEFRIDTPLISNSLIFRAYASDILADDWEIHVPEHTCAECARRTRTHMCKPYGPEGGETNTQYAGVCKHFLPVGATDAEAAQLKPKTLTWEEAVAEMRKGKRVTRRAFGDRCKLSLESNCGIDLIRCSDGSVYNAQHVAECATHIDWEVAE